MSATRFARQTPRAQESVAIDGAEHRSLGDLGPGQPGPQGDDRAGSGGRAVDEDLAPSTALLVDLGAAQVQRQALGAVFEVFDVEGHQLRAAEGAHVAHQQQRPIPDAGEGVGIAGDEQAQDVMRERATAQATAQDSDDRVNTGTGFATPSVSTLFDATAAIQRWSRTVVRENLVAAGQPNDIDLDVSSYLASVRGAASSDERFVEMVSWLVEAS